MTKGVVFSLVALLFSNALALFSLRSGSNAPRRSGSPRLPRLASTNTAEGGLILPKLCVLDLDMCVWSPEMYELSVLPTREKVEMGPLFVGDQNSGSDVQGVVGARSGSYMIRLFPQARRVFQDYHAGRFPGMRLAAASSADTPLAVGIGRAAMQLIEIVPGVTMEEVFLKGWEDDRNLQVGRTPPLSSEKWATHFPRLRDLTGIPYDKMLFFDDSLWSDHCGIVERKCPGVVCQRTPHGLTAGEWQQGLKKFDEASRREARS